MKHLVGMVERFQNEISHLQEYMQESFDTMEAGRLHQLLKKQYVQHEGIMGWWPELCFNLPNEDDRPSTIQRPSTPYPRDRPSSPHIKKPIHQLWYLPTASQYSLTASPYWTPPESPKPKPSSSKLSPTFIPEVLFLNPNFLPTFNGQDLTEDEFHQWLEEQYYERTIDKEEFCQCIEKQIDAQVQGLERKWANWMNYQGGSGTRYNPIIVENDWFRESLGVRGVMLWFFSSWHMLNMLFLFPFHYLNVSFLLYFMNMCFPWTIYFCFNMRFTPLFHTCI